jgi:hypothetical protein
MAAFTFIFIAWNDKDGALPLTLPPRCGRQIAAFVA